MFFSNVMFEILREILPSTINTAARTAAERRLK